MGEWNLETNPDCSEVDNCAPPVVDIPIEEKIIYKENSSNKNSRHDIALLRLKYQVKYSGKFLVKILKFSLSFSTQILSNQFVFQPLLMKFRRLMPVKSFW